MTKNFLKIKQGLYLSKDDLFFYEKYLRFFPKDANMRYEYAKALEGEGKIDAAFVQYEQAAKNGHLASIGKLKTAAYARTEPRKEEARKKNGFLRYLLFFFLFAFLLALLIILISWWYKHFVIQTASYQFAHTEVERYFGQSAAEQSVNTSPEELPLLVVENAIERFKQEKGFYPKDLSELTGPSPNNWLSFVPNGISYSLGRDSYTLSTGDRVSTFSDGWLELDYYPETNQLALEKGKEVLALYPVASGSPLPFTQSTVARRVVNPNGGAGALGTRGFLLQDNYAIHGTNQPNLVGQKGVTQGCLRMKNSDIETLYPYLSLGTPFHIKSGAPTPATFASGLPVLGSLTNPAKEESNGEHLNWR